jgi:hypothetical protein
MYGLSINIICYHNQLLISLLQTKKDGSESESILMFLWELGLGLGRNAMFVLFYFYRPFDPSRSSARLLHGTSLLTGGTVLRRLEEVLFEFIGVGIRLLSLAAEFGGRFFERGCLKTGCAWVKITGMKTVARRFLGYSASCSSSCRMRNDVRI